MEYIYWSLFLFYVISTFSSFILARPNIFDLSRTKGSGFSPRSTNPLSTASTRIFDLSRKNGFFLGSADPLSTRSPRNGSIRLGRSVSGSKASLSESDAYMSNGEFDSDVGYDQTISARTNKNGNMLCMYPQEDNADHLLCVSSHNMTNPFYAVAEPPSEDESDAIAKPDHASVYLRSVRAVNEGDHRVRKSKGTNFLRFGKAMTFSRYDRGRDNFLRFGRSDIKRKSSGNFIRFGRAFQERYSRPLTRSDHFMRLGLNSEENCDTAECVSRGTRRSDSFMRFGRPSNPLFHVQHGRALPDRDREISVMDTERTENDKRFRYSNFLRLGQRSRNFLRLGRSSEEECMDDDENCSNDKGRFKRSLDDPYDSLNDFPEKICFRSDEPTTEVRLSCDEEPTDKERAKRNAIDKSFREVKQNQPVEIKCECYQCFKETAKCSSTPMSSVVVDQPKFVVAKNST